jgi:transcriptional regulator with XRE-family HTH domain
LCGYRNGWHPDQVATEKKNPLGPTGEQVRENVKRLRTDRRLTYVELSDRLDRAGRPIPPLGLSRIERGDRRVDADDLVAIAHALGVNPSALLFPPTADPETSFEVTGCGRFPAEDIWNWADGRMPLVAGIWDSDAEVLFKLHARPKGRREISALGPFARRSPDEDGGDG